MRPAAVDTISIKVLGNSLLMISLTVMVIVLSPMENRHRLRSLTTTGMAILIMVVSISRDTAAPGEIAMSSVVVLDLSVMDIVEVKATMDRTATTAEATRGHKQVTTAEAIKVPKEDPVVATVVECELELPEEPTYISGRYLARKENNLQMPDRS